MSKSNNMQLSSWLNNSGDEATQNKKAGEAAGRESVLKMSFGLVIMSTSKYWLPSITLVSFWMLSLQLGVGISFMIGYWFNSWDLMLKWMHQKGRVGMLYLGSKMCIKSLITGLPTAEYFSDWHLQMVVVVPPTPGGNVRGRFSCWLCCQNI